MILLVLLQVLRFALEVRGQLIHARRIIDKVPVAIDLASPRYLEDVRLQIDPWACSGIGDSQTGVLAIGLFIQTKLMQMEIKAT